jgi:two-component system sensor histidine kinase HydH
MLMPKWFGGTAQAMLWVALLAWAAAGILLAPRMLSDGDEPLGRVQAALYLVAGLCMAAVFAARRAEGRQQAAAQARAVAAEEALRRHAEERRRLAEESERWRTEMERQARLAALGQLSARIAHDLRNTLGVVLNAAYLLRASLQRNIPPDADVIDLIETEVRNSSATINNLVTSARAEPPLPKLVDLARVVRSAFHEGAPRLGSTLTLRLSPAPFEIWVDPMQFAQVVRSVLQNSFEAAAGPVDIVVEATAIDGRHMIQLHDNGPGIPAGMRARMFEPFVSTKRKGGGLGLAICRQIIDRHGGTIELSSESKAGTAICICLPAPPPQQALMTSPASPQ